MSADDFDYGPFRVGDVVELHSITGTHARFNGRQVKIIKPLGLYGGIRSYGIDLPELRLHPATEVYGEPRFLRRKRPPTTGEQLIRAMFDAPPVERRETTTARLAQYDTTQALMAMGVRVRPGKWMVEVV
jgi:hypothetical protein